MARSALESITGPDCAWEKSVLAFLPCTIKLACDSAGPRWRSQAEVERAAQTGCEDVLLCHGLPQQVGGSMWVDARLRHSVLSKKMAAAAFLSSSSSSSLGASSAWAAQPAAAVVVWPPSLCTCKAGFCRSSSKSAVLGGWDAPGQSRERLYRLFETIRKRSWLVWRS